MRSIQTEGKTVEEAILKACETLNTTEEKLQIEVLENSSKGILSFFTARKVQIKAILEDSTVPTDIDPVSALKDFLETVVKKIYPESYVAIKKTQGQTILNIIGNGSGIFIGKNGQTLQAFQYILNKIMSNKYKNCPHIIVDSESYRLRRINSLTILANRLSKNAKSENGPVSTELLPSSDRKVIHMTLKKDSGITTLSKGEGNLKKVIIAPRN